jgi:hypothetical protein
VVRNPAHIVGYGTAFEGTISLRIRDDDGTVIAEGTTQGGSNGVIGEFKANLEFARRPNQRLGVVEAYDERQRRCRDRPRPKLTPINERLVL